MASVSAPLPRVTIQFCTQCKWMLRAAYFAQELLSTFGTGLGEVALQPSTGGTFIVCLYRSSVSGNKGNIEVRQHVLWDRKVEGRFPETKELKRRVRDIIDPARDLGHVDRVKESADNKHDVVTAERQQDLSSDKITAEAGSSTEPPEDSLEQNDSRILTNLQVQGEDRDRNFTPMETNDLLTTDDIAGKADMRNKDGSTCEDCG